MDLIALTQAFREGQISGPNGPLIGRRALLTRKSLLVWTGDSVLKLRRPRLVDGFDQDRVSTRYGMTARERWLGRQHSPHVYLGDCVLQIVFGEETASLRLVEGLVDGEPIVAMRALPDELRADVWLSEYHTDPALFFPVVEALFRVHTAQEAHRQPPFGSADRVLARLDELTHQIASDTWPWGGAFVEDTRRRIEHARPTLEHRVMEGRIRELHGEPALEHIFLGEPGQVALIDPHDGLDADRTFDVADDIFGLTLPVEMILGREFADTIVERYASLTLDLSLRKVGVIFRRLAGLRLVVEAIHEAADPEAVDPAAALERAAAILEHLRDDPG